MLTHSVPLSGGKQGNVRKKNKKTIHSQIIFKCFISTHITPPCSHPNEEKSEKCSKSKQLKNICINWCLLIYLY